MRTKQMFTFTILLLIYTIYVSYVIAQDYTQWNLPEGMTKLHIFLNVGLILGIFRKLHYIQLGEEEHIETL